MGKFVVLFILVGLSQSIITKVDGTSDPEIIPDDDIHKSFNATSAISDFNAAIAESKGLEDFIHRMQLTFQMNRLMSHIVGIVAHIPLPKFLRNILWPLYVKFEKVDMSWSLDPVFEHYPTFASFFTRRFDPKLRPIEHPDDPTLFTSPVDGHVTSVGYINSANYTFEAIKGVSYRLDEFMLGVKGEDGESYAQGEEPPINKGVQEMVDKVKARGNNLMFSILYLSPANYHRFHSPTIHTADYRRHIAGYLSLVHGQYILDHPDVFKVSERVSIFGRWAQGFYFEAPVGATNVGSIKLHYDDTLQTDLFSPPPPFYDDRSYGSSSDEAFTKYMNTTDFSHLDQETVPQFSKGEETGYFDMGSTVVIIFEAEGDVEWAVAPQDPVQVGMSLLKPKQE